MRTTDIYRGVTPFLAVFFVVLMLVTFLPQITLGSMEMFMPR